MLFSALFLSFQFYKIDLHIVQGLWYYGDKHGDSMTGCRGNWCSVSSKSDFPDLEKKYYHEMLSQQFPLSQEEISRDVERRNALRNVSSFVFLLKERFNAPYRPASLSLFLSLSLSLSLSFSLSLSLSLSFSLSLSLSLSLFLSLSLSLLALQKIVEWNWATGCSSTIVQCHTYTCL